MSRLKKEEVIQIVNSRNLTIANPDEYTSLDANNLILECDKGHTFVSNLKSIRDLSDFRCPICDQQKVKYKVKPPVKSGYRIVAFDQATQNFGISIYDDDQLVYFDVIKFTGDTEDRLLQISNFIDSVCKNWLPDYVMFEDIQLQQNNYGGYNTFKVLAELLGVVKVTLQRNKVPHGCVMNKIWQATFGIAGRDRATQKSNVIKKVKDLFSVQVNDDIADAILIGKHAVIQKGKSKKLF